MVSAAGVADCAQDDGLLRCLKILFSKNYAAERKSWNGNQDCCFNRWEIDQFHSGTELLEH